MKSLAMFAAAATCAMFGGFTGTASAAALGFTGTAGFAVVGGVVNLAGGACFPLCDSGFVAFNTGVLNDGVIISGLVRETIVEDGLGDTTSALLRVTNIVATNTNIAGPVRSDTLFLVSDIFDPSLAGTGVGVGIIGSFLAGC